MALIFIKYDMPVDLDEIVNRPPPEDDAIVKFALRIVLYWISKGLNIS